MGPEGGANVALGGGLCICFIGCAYLHERVGVVTCTEVWLLHSDTHDDVYEDSHVTKMRDLRTGTSKNYPFLFSISLDQHSRRFVRAANEIPVLCNHQNGLL